MDNAAVTADGGATWTLARPGLSGFRSAVTWVPGAGEHSLIAVGPSGADWSADGGRTWSPVPGEGFDTVSVAPHSIVGWAAGQGGRISKLTLTRVFGR